MDSDNELGRERFELMLPKGISAPARYGTRGPSAMKAVLHAHAAAGASKIIAAPDGYAAASGMAAAQAVRH